MRQIQCVKVSAAASVSDHPNILAPTFSMRSRGTVCNSRYFPDWNAQDVLKSSHGLSLSLVETISQLDSAGHLQPMQGNVFIETLTAKPSKATNRCC